MTTHAPTTEQAPAQFQPRNPDALYESMLARMPAGVDGSIYWSTLWCQYVGDDQKRTNYRRAKEMRWMAREWRARKNGAPVPAVAWSGRQIVPRSDLPCGIPGRQCAPAEQKRGTSRMPRDGEAERREREARNALYVAAYLEIGTITGAAKKCAARVECVRQAVRAAGIEIVKQPRPLKPMELPELPGLYREGVFGKEIARRLGVSRSTVEKHIRRLVAEGVLQPRHKGGPLTPILGAPDLGNAIEH